MDHHSLRGLLLAHPVADPLEASCREQILAALDARVFSKTTFSPGHVTSSALVVSPDERSILLVAHRDFGLWLQPGGHLDPQDEDLLAAARRELREECGLTQLDRPAWAAGILDLDVHRVPQGLKRGEPAHLHFDVRFAFRARTLAVQAASDAKDARWFPLDDLDGVDTDDSVRRAARRLLRRRSR